MRSPIAVVTLLLASSPLMAQDSSAAPPHDTAVVHHDTSVAHHNPAVAAAIHAGDSLEAALHPDSALVRFREALALDPTNYNALWKAAKSIQNVAKQIDSDQDALKKQRDSMYVQARAWAEAAVAVNEKGSEGHSTLAQAIGRLSRTKGGKERVKFAKVIYDEAMTATELDSTNDPAYHVLGAWNAEIKRLSGMTRFFAKTMFGADFMDKANWADAQKYLKRAIAIRPANVYHHLELAEVYVDLKKYDKAREQLKIVQDLPIADVLDHKYKTEAAELMEEIKDKKEYS
jgi:tetratricopeptide (TPR) repeat protein